MWIASCTKLMTSIAAMQCVERGLLKLDDGIYDVLPEFKGMPVIKGFMDDGSPIMEPHKNKITLRHLLTHSSGLAYDETHPLLIGWRKWQRRTPSRGPTIDERFLTPLVFEPGSAWMYGSGIDWAGQMVERVSGGITLQEYMETNIWHPLGIKDMTFFLQQRPDMAKRRADMSKRDPAQPNTVKRSNAILQFEGTKDCMGGLGVFSSAEEYIKILAGLLRTDKDEKLMKRESVEEFFKPQLSEKARASLNKLMKDEQMNNAMGGTPQGIGKDWGLGGLLNMADVPEGRTAGTMVWGGLPNLSWVSFAEGIEEDEAYHER